MLCCSDANGLRVFCCELNKFMLFDSPCHVFQIAWRPQLAYTGAHYSAIHCSTVPCLFTLTAWYKFHSTYQDSTAQNFLVFINTGQCFRLERHMDASDACGCIRMHRSQTGYSFSILCCCTDQFMTISGSGRAVHSSAS